MACGQIVSMEDALLRCISAAKETRQTLQELDQSRIRSGIG